MKPVKPLNSSELAYLQEYLGDACDNNRSDSTALKRIDKLAGRIDAINDEVKRLRAELKRYGLDKKIATRQRMKNFEYDNEFVSFTASLKHGHEVRITCTLTDVEIVDRDNHMSYSMEQYAQELNNIEFEQLY